jgi:hypothetical protein
VTTHKIRISNRHPPPFHSAQTTNCIVRSKIRVDPVPHRTQHHFPGLRILPRGSQSLDTTLLDVPQQSVPSRRGCSRRHRHQQRLRPRPSVPASRATQRPAPARNRGSPLRLRSHRRANVILEHPKTIAKILRPRTFPGGQVRPDVKASGERAPFVTKGYARATEADNRVPFVGIDDYIWGAVKCGHGSEFSSRDWRSKASSSDSNSQTPSLQFSNTKYPKPQTLQ